MTDKGIYDLFYDILRELAEIKKNQWSQESQQQLVETLTELNNVMAQQTQIAEKQSKVLLQLDKYLEEEEEPEPMVS